MVFLSWALHIPMEGLNSPGSSSKPSNTNKAQARYLDGSMMAEARGWLDGGSRMAQSWASTRPGKASKTMLVGVIWTHGVSCHAGWKSFELGQTQIIHFRLGARYCTKWPPNLGHLHEAWWQCYKHCLACCPWANSLVNHPPLVLSDMTSNIFELINDKLLVVTFWVLEKYGWSWRIRVGQDSPCKNSSPKLDHNQSLWIFNHFLVLWITVRPSSLSPPRSQRLACSQNVSSQMYAHNRWANLDMSTQLCILLDVLKVSSCERVLDWIHANRKISIFLVGVMPMHVLKSGWHQCLKVGYSTPSYAAIPAPCICSHNGTIQANI